MLNMNHIINYSNVLPALRYLLNLDINTVNEKFTKIGISNFIDLAQTKRLYFNATHSPEMPSQKSDDLLTHTLSLTSLLNDEAKNNLLEFLAINQSY